MESVISVFQLGFHGELVYIDMIHNGGLGLPSFVTSGLSGPLPDSHGDIIHPKFMSRRVTLVGSFQDHWEFQLPHDSLLSGVSPLAYHPLGRVTCARYRVG